jgi:hypothetical protein
MSATLLLTPDRRISLETTPRPRGAEAFEIVLVGHCPGRHAAGAAARLAPAVALAGFDAAAARIGTGQDAPGALEQVPLPLGSAAEFDRLFPEADTVPTGLGSRAAGRRAFLPRTVRDAFRAGARRVWVIAAPEPPRMEGMTAMAAAIADGFGLGRAGAGDPARPETLRGIGLALAIPDAALLALPDLERLAIGTRAAAPDAPTPPGEPPIFRPKRPMPPPRGFSTVPPAPDHDAPDAAEIGAMLASLGILLARRRPDMQALVTLPLGLGHAAGRSDAAAEAAAVVAEARKALPTGQPGGLRRLQLLHPMLRAPDGAIGSASGAIAGAIAANAERDGPWRSIASRPLLLAAMPATRFDPSGAARLREAGFGVLTGAAGRVALDDERMAPEDKDEEGRALGRSAEVVRFLGWLQRRLRRLGEALVFENRPDDGRLELALRGFLMALQARGALRGATAERGFELVPLRLGEGAIGFEIRLAPVLPVDRIRIQLVAAPAGTTVEAGLG